MFGINDRDIRRLERTLGEMSARAIPYATRNTLNQAAFAVRAEYQKNIRDDLINRNKFTERSVRVERAQGTNITTQKATVGSIADYMDEQEFGDTKTANGAFGVPLATSYSAGQTGQRTRLPRKPNKMQNINLRGRGGRSRSRKQQNFLAVRMAAQSGSKYVFLDLDRGAGIFKVVGGKRRPKVKMIHDLSRRSVVIPANPLLRRSTDAVAPRMPDLYRDSLEFQISRLSR